MTDSNTQPRFLYSPINGHPLGDVGVRVDEYRLFHPKVTWGFNPWTGLRRDPKDICLDPYGLLIIPPGAPIAAEPPAPAAHPLEAIFAEVIAQVTSGKGTRHGGDTTPFLEQPWAHYARLHGRGFLTGQAAKKLEEAASRGLVGEAFDREVLGAIAYIGMAILENRRTT